jgi:Spy/CpxP family protein refolding chaperone
MTNTKKIFGALALAAGIATTGIVGFAQQQTQQGATAEQNGQRHERRWNHEGEKGDHGMRGGMGFGHFGRNLNLTDAQKTQMQQIAERYQASNKAMREQSGMKREGGFDAFKDGTFNEAQVRAAAQARANARVEMEVAHARMMSEMYAVLTPEQKAQLATERQQMEQKRQERRAQREAAKPVVNN